MNRFSRLSSPLPRRGFALIDLVALIGGSAVLAGLLLPGLAKAAKSGQAAVCLNNLRQMARACQMYTADNRDRLPGAFHAKASNPLKNDKDAPWAVGWLTWDTSSHNTNTLFVADLQYASLSWYTRGDPRLVKCPADPYVSEAQRRKGWAERVRSISVSVGIGEGDAETGPWEATFKHVRRIPEILYPSPAETWLFLDEHPDSMNDPSFFSPRKTAWIDLPASYHNGACGLVFVDGRAELHKWRGSTVWPVKMGGFGRPTPISPEDIDWLRYHTPRVSEAY